MNSLPPTSRTPSPSIVVLPFVNTSADLENEFFCDGLAEDLISALTKLAQLRVVARTSAFSFKGQNLDVREIGRRLNVGAVLEGSVRRAGNRLRITVQIVNVADGFDLWSERYDRQLTDIFDIQDEITLAIVESLKVKLLSGQQAVLLKRPTENLEAWEWYQKARWHFGLFNPDSFSNAIECAQKAVEADPDFAQAWAFMSLLFSMLAVWGGGNQEDLLARSLAAAKKALALDEQLGDSQCAMGVSLSCAFNLEAAEWHLRHAQELNPNDSTTRAFYANCALTPQGKFDEALTQFRLAHESDPLSMAISSSMGYVWYAARRYEEGLAHIWPLIEMAPTYVTNYLEAGRCLAQLNRLDEALSVLEQSVKLSGGMSFDLATLGYVYGLVGKRDEAEQVLNQLTQRGFFAECGLVCAGINDIDEAFRWLELSYAKRQAVLSLHLRVEPGYDRLRDDPRFIDLVERVYGSSSLVNGARSAAKLFQQAERLYYRALELSVSERAGLLSQACGADEELRHEVESLLAAHDEAGSFIAGKAVEDHAERIASPKQASHEDDATAMLPNPLTDSAQRRINQYKIISLLGKGGMGEVWLAEDTRLKRKVALKLLPAEFTNDADRLRRFEQEALAISALNHPNIITIHEIGESEAGRFIVMELVAGRTLRAMTAESITVDSLIAWGNQIAKALHVAHAAGITHRDIKPDNIMVRDDGYVKVLDFGLARLDASRENFGEAEPLAGTKSGVLLGTVKYMSPEQARGEKVTSATDIFALGVLFYELATGTHPFNSATLLGTLQQITTETPRPPAQLNPGLPAAIDALIQRMLAKDASARPSAAQLEAALREIERQQNSGTAGSGALQPPTLLSTRRTVGRKPERLELRAAFNSAKSGRGSLLCVAGEPGIGKTTLVEDFLAELATEGQCTIARGRCSERLAGTEAYLPLLEALESLLQSGSDYVVRQAASLSWRGDQPNRLPAETPTSWQLVGHTSAHVMKQFAPTWYAQVVPLSGDSEESARLLAEVKAASQERMKRELASFLQAVAQTQPLVIFFDDLHWADVSTVDLLSFLAGKFDALNVLIVVTYRPSDMLLAKHPFLQIKPDLQARGVCRELLLEFLTEAEIAEYLALEFPSHRFPPEFPKLIHAKTEGSPLFMADLVRYLRDRGVIAEEESTRGACVPILAQALPDIERELPESVRGMIERKIAQLSEDDRKLLTCASVQGYEFDSAIVAQVLNLDADEVEERLENLERVFAFVKLTNEAEFPNRTLTLKYRFVHVLYQNALYASLRATRKAALSREVALALEACYGTRSASMANELALLWEAARDYARASDSFLQAASNAAQFNAHGEAVQLAERGLAVLLKSPETQERDKRELGLQLTRGISLMSVMGWTAPEAGTAFHRARQLCQQWGDDSRLFAVLNGTAHHHQVRAEYEIARELYEQMRQIAEQSQNPALMVVAATRLALSYSWTGKDFNLGRQLFEQAIALNRQEYHPSYLLVSNDSQGVTAHRVGCYFLWVLGYSDQAMAIAQKGVTLAERLSHPFSLGGAYAGTGVTHFLLRDWQASQQEIEKIFALAEQYDLGDILKWAIAFNALNLAFQEPTEAAFTRAKQAIASLRAKGVMLGMTWCLSGLAEACWQANRSEEGLAIIAEAQTLAERTGERSYEADIWRVKGELLLQAAADDAQTEAESCYQKAFAIARQQSAKIFELRATTSLARLWQQQGKIAEARQMLAEIYGWFTEGFDTADLKDAKALLDELNTVSAVPALNRRHTVGREKERAELLAGFAAAQAGRGSLLCVAGEPGIGKTTLVEDFLAELAADQQCTIARGRCSERLAGTEAYLPLLEALEALLRYGTASGSESGSFKMKQLAPTWYAQVVPLSGDSEESARLLAEVKAASQERMKRELANFLQAVATPQPLVIFFDDLHWADVSTIDLLSFLAGKFDALNVLIVVTYRPSDMLLAKHPFLQIKPDLQARGVCRELLLEFLTEAEIAEYLALEFPGHRFPPAFPQLIHAKTEGSPLFMADLVRYLRDRSVIANTSGAWKLEQTLPDIERELPESVRGMIERKIAQLSEDDRKLLTAASVQGYEFDSAVVAQVLNLDADEVEERLEKLERVFAFVKLTSEGEFPNGTLTLKYRFVHVLYQNALYGGLRMTRKASLSGAVAQCLTGFYGEKRGNIASELARLFEAARDFGQSVEFYLLAAQQSAELVANAEAAVLAQHGLRLLKSLPDSHKYVQKELTLELTLGMALAVTRGYAAPEAGISYARARELCQSLGNSPEVFLVLWGLWGFYMVGGDLETSRQIGEQMLQVAQASNEKVMLAAAHKVLGFTLTHMGEVLLAHEHLEQSIHYYDPLQHQSYLSLLRFNPGVYSSGQLPRALWILGYPDQARQKLQEAFSVAEKTGDSRSLAMSQMFATIFHTYVREYAQVQHFAETCIAHCNEHDIAQEQAWAIVWGGNAIATQGDTEKGIAMLRDVIAQSQVMGAKVAFTEFHAMLAQRLGDAGKTEEALATIQKAIQLSQSLNENYFNAEIQRVKGGLLLNAGATQAEAEACYQQAIAIARQQSAKSWELRAATSLARLWQQQGKTAEARQMLAEIYGWFTEGFDTADLKDAKALLDELQLQVTEAARYGTGSGSDLVSAEARYLEAPGRYRSPFRTEEYLEALGRYRSPFRTKESPSIAVLPFANISNDPDNEYFCDGLAEELLNALSKIEALHVAARTSSFSFKGKETDIREIGQKLNVGAVLEGSVRKSGNRLRITAQLINIVDGYHLWSERYDRQMEDIFDIQDEISLAIVDALKVKLLGAEKAAVTKRYTENTEAYELYLKGRFHYGKWTEEGLKKSIEFFNQAISQEPNFAPAYAGVVNAYVFLWFYGFSAPDESISIIKSAAARAVAIDNDSAESQFAVTRMKVFYEWDWSGADSGFRRTLTLNPNHAEAIEQYAVLLAALGRADEAISLGRRALELNPLSLITNLNVGYIYWAIGRYDLVPEQGEKLIELSSNFHGGYMLIAVEQWGTGKYEQAISTYQTAVSLSAGPLALAYLGYLYGLVGKRDEAQKILHQLQELSAQRHALPFEMAMVSVGLGELDRAFALLEKAYEQRAGILIYFKYIAKMMPGFRDEPRLADLLRRIGLPE